MEGPLPGLTTPTAKWARPVRPPMQGSRGGSVPVLGELLLVAVVLTGAVLVGTFALGYGESATATPPVGAFDAELADGGDGSDRLALQYTAGDRMTGVSLEVDNATDGTGQPVSLQSTAVPDLTAGETLVVGPDRFAGVEASPAGPGERLRLADATVRLVYEFPDANRTAIVYEWNGSAA